MQQPPATSAVKAIGVLALVFFCGFTTGFLWNYFTETPSPERSRQVRIDKTLQDLSRDLSLNPSQAEQVREILDDVIMEEAELLSQLEMNQLEARDRIAAFLTPEQRELFTQMMSQATIEVR